MTKIALTAAAILVATGTAFASSDYYGSNNANQPAVTASAANVDTTFTASIRKPVEHYGAVKTTSDTVQPESGQGIWGH
ncbi:DUF680 domain-containing protein [Mesorhizobium sp. ORS 3428]|uniref:DUF680 domain-containing protein n=1 Tax=Mesorhizobium sp. ORS 3428 TaxID=540997 RepID=UPI0008DA293C|nr:DUF680 domain-containing protein [Mesorhizobium sp. ORS 3428]OHV86811.1 hypothetical protein ORS3428_06385 [Mesorhizobium sp. ORS 3428]